MSRFPEARPVPLAYGTDDKAIFNFFNAVYAWMAVGLAVTACVAYAVSLNPTLLPVIGGRGIAVAFLIASVILVWGIRGAAMRLPTPVALTMFVAYAAFIGFFFAWIFLVYRLDSIAGVFVITAGTFAATSAYGYITKRDLTSMGSFLFMALVGLFLATIVNIFWANTVLYWAITYIGLAVFIALTAYDSQKLKQMAIQTQGNPAMAGRLAVIGSLELYLDFINMFIFLLRILGRRK